MSYCESIAKTKRWPTRVVKVGKVMVGGSHPIVIQSMTTSSTRDVEATVQEIMQLRDHGCQIARVTVQGMKEAQSCEAIKNQLLRKGYDIPLVADIHFYPPAAMHVVDFVDKVRINPGNFVDKRATFKTLTYTDTEYAIELEQIETKFTPLVEKCKKLGCAMRIGTNHGSLSDRIMNYYGDTPKGMVESAFEYVRVARKLGYHDIIFSMKSSNTHVMIQAYRLLVQEMRKLGWDYPLHLGVTEAGAEEEGRVKSAVGIGALLLDGLGDTIRVSLTEDPVFEIDPCKRLIALAEKYRGKGVEEFPYEEKQVDVYRRRSVSLSREIPLHASGSVWSEGDDSISFYSAIGLKEKQGQWYKDSLTVDGVVARSDNLLALSDQLKSVVVPLIGSDSFPIVKLSEKLREKPKFSLFASPLEEKRWPILTVQIDSDNPLDWDKLHQIRPQMILFPLNEEDKIHPTRKFFEYLQQENLSIPVILEASYTGPFETVIVESSAELGLLLCDGYGEGILIRGPYPLDDLRKLSFNILQACRMRMSKTEFISCPSCGRTLFELQAVSRAIREKTSHLPGVKIAIMGCVVNGPGEMADADFGYVGSKPGKIDLYVGKKCVQKDIDHTEAVEVLIGLIKAAGKWEEPSDTLN